MENNKISYIKPTHKIVARFASECFKFLKRGENILPSLLDFPVYFRHNRRMKMALDAGLPWISYRALQRLNEIIRPEMSVLEFGSGGSTLYLASRVASLTSVEHDQSWAEIVSIKKFNDPNKKIYYIPSDETCREEEFMSEYGMRYSGRCFKSYVLKAEDFAEESLDLVIIDGRARPACLKYSITKVKPGGFILFDNSDRPGYQPSISTYLPNWKREDFKGVTVYDAFFNATSIFQKPY